MGMAVERMSAESWLPPWVRYQHEARYAWAAEQAPGCVILDAACGTGYGARALIDHGAKSVSGFDLSDEAIATASRLNIPGDVTFAIGDVAHLPVQDGSVDLYLSFETIEHLPDDDAYLAEARRVLKPDGRLICSTPNRTITNPGTTINDMPFNPFHLREYAQPELQERLRYHFSHIEWFGQSAYSVTYANCLRRIAGLHPRLAVRLHQIRKTLCLPWETPQRHRLIPLQSGRFESEILVAVCRN